MGFRGAALVAVLASCVKEEDTYVEALTLSGTSTATTPTTTPTVSTITTEELNKITNYKLKLDLSTTANAKLKTVGGYITQSSIVVALTSTGYVAATQTCTHEPKKQVIYSQNEFYCTAHGARFSTAGKGLNSLGSKGLTVYKVATDGKTVVVY